ncbi:mechanosensitive ion channel family protein [Thermomonas sp.]|uniref:mechanosensitive ion channel family protein n=1 Tax=Thermomonas sp. TaxID=1971895 RepID=UPI003D130DD3
MGLLQPDAVVHRDAIDLMRDVRGIDWLGLLETWGLRVLATVLIFLLGRWLARRLARGLDRVLGRAGVDATLGGFLHNIAYAVMIVLVIMTALSALGIPTTSMFALLGAAGLAVGLAIKDSLSNIAAGVMLIVLRPFRAGDHVVIAGQEGIVQEIRVFQTWLRTFDHRVIILPNSQITTTQIINYSLLPLRRMEVPVGVGYGDDLKKARELLLKIAQEHPSIVDDPPPVARVMALADSSITLTLYAFTRNDDHVDTRSQVVEAIRDEFAANGLNIPFPQRDLHLYYAEPPAAGTR